LAGFDGNEKAGAAPFEREGLAGDGADSDIDGAAVERMCGVGEDAGGAVEIGIARAPEEVAGADAGEVDVAVAELDSEEIFAERGDGIDAAAFLFFLGAAPGGGIEDDAVAGLEGGDGMIFVDFDEDAIGLEGGDGAEEDTAVAGGAGLDDLLVVGAAQEEGGEAAGVDLFEAEAVFGADGGEAVDGFTVGGGGEGDVFGVLVAAFDF